MDRGENVIKSRNLGKLSPRIHGDMYRLRLGSQTLKNERATQMLWCSGQMTRFTAWETITCETQLCAGSCQYHYFGKDEKEWKLGTGADGLKAGWAQRMLFLSLSLSPSLCRPFWSHAPWLSFAFAILGQPSVYTRQLQGLIFALLMFLKKIFPARSEHSHMVPEAPDTGQAKGCRF